METDAVMIWVVQINVSKHANLLACYSDVGRHARTHGTASPNASLWRHGRMPSHVEVKINLVVCGDREQ